MGVGAGLYMCDLVKKFTFAISSPDEFLWLFGWAYPEETDCVCMERMLCVYKDWTGGWLCVGWWFTGDSEEVCCWCKLWARHWHSRCVFCCACKTNIKKVRFKFVLSLSLQLTCTLWCIYSSSICFTHVEAWPVWKQLMEKAPVLWSRWRETSDLEWGSEHSVGWCGHTGLNHTWIFEHVSGECTLHAQNVDIRHDGRLGPMFGGKSWVAVGCLYSLETKEQSKPWKHKESLQSKKFRVEPSASKIICNFLWCWVYCFNLPSQVPTTLIGCSGCVIQSMENDEER